MTQRKDRKCERWKRTGKELRLEEHHRYLGCGRKLVVYPNILATTTEVIVDPFNQPNGGFGATNLSSNPWHGSVLNILLKSRNTALKPLHSLPICNFMACVKHETAWKIIIKRVELRQMVNKRCWLAEQKNSSLHDVQYYSHCHGFVE